MGVLATLFVGCENKAPQKEDLEQEEYKLLMKELAEETKNMDLSDDDSKEYVGIWRVKNNSFPKAAITEIYKQDGKYFEKGYDEGNKDRATINRLIKKGNKYRDPENTFGEYYIVTSSGELRLCDDEHGDFTKEMGYTTQKIK